MRRPSRKRDSRAVMVALTNVTHTPYSATLPFLDAIDADYCVHGDDISINADGTDAYGEARKAGRLKVVKRTEGVSTTDLVGRLLLLTKSHHTPALCAPALQFQPSVCSQGRLADTINSRGGRIWGGMPSLA